MGAEKHSRRAGAVVAATAAIVAAVVLRHHRRNGPRVWTKAELRQYDGVQRRDQRICLSIMGNVFDVTRGRQFYAPTKSYAFYAGIDGSLSFVTGDFEKNLTDDVAQLTGTELYHLATWVNGTFHKKYDYQGVLVGYFYDAQGRETPALREATRLIEVERGLMVLREADEARFHKCNSKRSKGTNIVWCPATDASEEGSPAVVRVPRRRIAFGATERCACVDAARLADLREEAESDFRVYDGCDPTATTCDRDQTSASASTAGRSTRSGSPAASGRRS